MLLSWSVATDTAQPPSMHVVILVSGNRYRPKTKTSIPPKFENNELNHVCNLRPPTGHMSPEIMLHLWVKPGFYGFIDKFLKYQLCRRNLEKMLILPAKTTTSVIVKRCNKIIHNYPGFSLEQWGDPHSKPENPKSRKHDLFSETTFFTIRQIEW